MPKHYENEDESRIDPESSNSSAKDFISCVSWQLLWSCCCLFAFHHHTLLFGDQMRPAIIETFWYFKISYPSLHGIYFSTRYLIYTIKSPFKSEWSYQITIWCRSKPSFPIFLRLERFAFCFITGNVKNDNVLPLYQVLSLLHLECLGFCFRHHYGRKMWHFIFNLWPRLPWVAPIGPHTLKAVAFHSL